MLVVASKMVLAGNDDWVNEDKPGVIISFLVVHAIVNRALLRTGRGLVENRPFERRQRANVVRRIVADRAYRPCDF